MKGAKFVDVSGIRTRYFEAGNGDPLLLINGGQFGFYSCALDWGGNFDTLAKDFHVYAIDKIGQGHTDNPKEDADYVMGTTVWHVREFMEHLGIQSAHLAGHSRGGYTICRLALEYPELVKCLIIVDSGTLMDKSRSWYNEVAAKSREFQDKKEAIKYTIAANSYGTEHIAEEWLQDLLEIGNLPKFQEAMEKWPSLESRFISDHGERLVEMHEWIRGGRLKSPTLLIWGFNDPSSTLQDIGIPLMNLIFENVPAAQMHILNKAGHYCYREQPESFVAAVRGFIGSNR